MDSEDSDLENVVLTPEEVIATAYDATVNLLPKKSQEIYLKEYNAFMEWRSEKKVESFTERVLLACFKEKSKKFKASTMWSCYSKLKATLNIHNNVDISKYSTLIPYLKRQSVGYKARKSKSFTRGEVFKFLLEAPDKNYLMQKVALIFGLAGALRRNELYKLRIQDVEMKDSILLVTIPDSKTHIQRRFTVIGKTGIHNLNLLDIIKKYVQMRPKNLKSDHLFFSYRNGKSVSLVIGINTFSKIPSIIASYLNLPQPNLYTGHAFRRSSASLLVDSGGDLLQLKQHGGWKSSSVAEGYVDNSMKTKVDCATKIFVGNHQQESSVPSTSLNIDTSIWEVPESHNLPSTSTSQNVCNLRLVNSNNNGVSKDLDSYSESSLVSSGININNSSNCTFNIILK